MTIISTTLLHYDKIMFMQLQDVSIAKHPILLAIFAFDHIFVKLSTLSCKFWLSKRMLSTCFIFLIEISRLLDLVGRRVTKIKSQKCREWPVKMSWQIARSEIRT